MKKKKKCKVFAKMVEKFFETPEKLRKSLRKMTKIATDKNLEKDERRAAIDTIQEILYPTEPVDIEDKQAWE